MFMLIFMLLVLPTILSTSTRLIRAPARITAGGRWTCGSGICCIHTPPPGPFTSRGLCRRYPSQSQSFIDLIIVVVTRRR
ncbi:hypothetical protein QR685DRAFT_528355 [Neurospora intermedia]|uniref:Secreted peptide n=1 Tax=Neurospora intermedia TaxID=5142 RepID=A0ABR3D8N9_NEUIN